MVVGNDQQPDYASLDLAQARVLLAKKDDDLALLIHRIEQLEKMVFGPRSAKRTGPIDPKELLPFPHLQQLIDAAVARAEERARQAEAVPSTPPPEQPARRSARRALDGDIPDHLPRRRRARKLSDEECKCGCGGRLVEIREEVARRLEQLKLLFVDERVTTYYACRNCERMVSAAPDQDSIVEGSILGPSLVADLVYQRFGNHTPYNRLQREFEQQGVPISRTVIGRNVLKCGDLLQPIYEQIRREVLGSFLVQVDDTPVVVRNGIAKGRKTGRVWIYRAPCGDVLFEFRMDRSNQGPFGVLGSYSGFVQGDAYSGHDILFRDTTDRTELGCWAHVVRGFRDAESTNRKVVAEFNVLFALLDQVEKEARSMSPPQRLLYRSKHARPVLAELEQWLDARSTTVAPKSPIGKAIAYVRNQWLALTNYLLDGRITDITNNGAERALRRVALGRKNWMHVGAEDAGPPATILMSILQTCAEHQVNALQYLRDVLARIRQPGSAAQVADLTPKAWKRDQAAQERAARDRAAIAQVVQSLACRS